MKKLILVTTVSQTFSQILSGQLAFLSMHFEVHIVCSGSPVEVQRIAKANNVASAHVIPMNRGISPFKDIISIIRMMRVVRQVKPDIVHSYTPKAGLVTAISSFILKVPVRVHTFTGLIFPYKVGFKRFVLKNVDSLICKLCTHVVPEGEGVKKLLQPITSKELKVVGSGNIAGVDFNYFNRLELYPIPRTLESIRGLSSSNFVFCFIGRINPDKGLGELLHAFEKLYKLHDNVALLIVGGLDSSVRIPPDIAFRLSNQQGVIWAGEVDDVRPYLAHSDILVLPSYREGFPNVVLQAGAMGKPSIVTDVCGSNELIINDFNGWIVPPKNQLELFNAMLLAKTSSKLPAFAERAYIFVRSRFEREHYHKKLLDFYSRLS